MDLEKLQRLAKKVRIDIIEMLKTAKTGHPGGALSLVEILIILYFVKMHIDPRHPQLDDRDRFILSKGHGAPALYAILAERGFFPVSELGTLRQYKSRLQGHPDLKSTPGVDMSSGSLGQGLSIANGMAMAAKLKKEKHHTYVILGDGELQEGQIWEAVMTAAHYKLDNLTAIVDYNGLQINGRNEDVINIAPIGDKFKTFGWNVIEIDGHDLLAISKAIDTAKECMDKPTVIVAKTVKGKGISFMENVLKWHGTTPNEAECNLALVELGGDRK
ncbi:transketolase [Anaerosinus sp.]|uniref:transketolase n=1 Tax=Selenobaculum sp. TaxID=3074374 RepID=UPI003AB9073D